MSYFDPSEHSAASPAESAEGHRRVDVMMNPYAKLSDKLEVEMLVATEIQDNLDMYTRLDAPQKPNELPLDDQKIVERLRFAKALAHPKQDDLEIAALFGAWRCAVFTLESRNASRLEMLFQAIRTLQRTFAETGCEGASLAKLVSFTQAEWNVKVPNPVPDFWTARRWAAWAAQEHELMPSWLRRSEDRPMPSALKPRAFTNAAHSSRDDD